MDCGTVLRLWAQEERAQDPVSRSCISWMESLMFKRKSLAGKSRHEWIPGFLASVGFPTLLLPSSSPALIGRSPQTALGEDRVPVPAQVPTGIPKTRARHGLPAPLSPAAEPGCLAAPARAASCSKLQGGTHCRASLQTKGRGEGVGSEENEKRGKAWPWNPFQFHQFHNLCGTPHAKLGIKEIIEKKN